MRNPEASWRDTRKTLRKDHRWELAELLDREEKEKLFDEHIEELTKKAKDMFHKLLDETSEVQLTACQMCDGFLKLTILNLKTAGFCDKI